MLILPRRRALITGAAALATMAAGPRERRLAGNVNGNLRRGLVGYWKFDEGIGNVCRNSSPFPNRAALASSPSWVAGKFGTGILFNGSSQSGDASATFPPSPSQVTISFWAKPLDTGDFQVIVSLGASSQLWLGLYSGNYFFNYDNNHGLSSGISPTSGWDMVAATVNNSTSQIIVYVNGVAVASVSATSGSIASGDVSFGYQNGSGQYYNGALDEVRVFSRCLSAAEIKQLYRLRPDEGQ